MSGAASRTLVVTRPQPQAGQWVAALQARGQPALLLPLLHIEADPRFAPAVEAAWQSLPSRDMVMFVSPNAVARFFEAALGRRWPPGVMAGATGPGTVAALQAAGVCDADIVAPAPDAPRFDAETLWQQRLAMREWSGRSVLIVRGATGRDWLAETLRQAGARLDLVSAYRSVPAVWDDSTLRTLAAVAHSPGAHAWLFSSSKAIDGLTPRLAVAARGCALATHPRIATAARAAGFHPVLDTRPDLDSVLSTLHSV